jgi:hypothetical protein
LFLPLPLLLLLLIRWVAAFHSSPMALTPEDYTEEHSSLNILLKSHRCNAHMHSQTVLDICMPFFRACSLRLTAAGRPSKRQSRK